jgi:uncharacterized protein (TIGR00255 family)
MLRSMTGYARWQGECDGRAMEWEIRSVNHRFLETSFRLPEELRAVEHSFKELVAANVSRGKVDLSLRLKESSIAAVDQEIDTGTLQRLRMNLATVSEQLGSAAAPDPLAVLRWPGVLREPQANVDQLQASATEGLTQALSGLLEHRSREGSRIETMLRERMEGVRTQVNLVRNALPELRKILRSRIEEKLSHVVERADPERLEQELALLLTKSDVAEELDRLDAHVAELETVFAADEPAGRRLDFLMQEFNREANTLASKAQASDQTRSAVELKVLVEQMREQIQNIE